MARKPTAEEVEHQALLLFEAAFSTWVANRSAVVRQHREAFERECNDASRWSRHAFANWLPDHAKAEVCAELRLLRNTFAKELEATGPISITPPRMTRIVHHVGHLVRQAKWRRHPADYAVARKKGQTQAERIQSRLQGLITALQLLLAPEDDPLLSDVLSGLQSLIGESLLCQALRRLDSVEPPAGWMEAPEDDPLLSDVLSGLQSLAHPTARLSFALNDLDCRLQSWKPPDQPIERSHLESLLRVYEKASGGPVEAASWYDGKPSGAFSRFLVMIYEALPEDVRLFVASSPQAFVKQADRLIRKRKRARDPKIQDDSE